MTCTISYTLQHAAIPDNFKRNGTWLWQAARGVCVARLHLRIAGGISICLLGCEVPHFTVHGTRKGALYSLLLKICGSALLKTPRRKTCKLFQAHGHQKREHLPVREVKAQHCRAHAEAAASGKQLLRRSTERRNQLKDCFRVMIRTSGRECMQERVYAGLTMLATAVQDVGQPGIIPTQPSGCGCMTVPR